MDRLTVARHLHTCNHRTPSQCVTVDDVAGRYRQVDAIVIEDHFQFGAPSRTPNSDSGPMVLPGREWAVPVHRSGRRKSPHHVGILGVDTLEQSRLKISPHDAPSIMEQKVHLADGALVYNHPEYPYIDTARSSARALDYSLPLKEAAAFDAVEVFNDVGFKGSEPAKVLQWVERTFYKKGVFPAVVAGQDDHGPDPVAAEPSYTMAMVNNRSEAGLMAAIRERRTFVSKSLDAQLTMSVDGRSAWGRSGSVRPGPHRYAAALRGLPQDAVIEVVRNGHVIGRTVARFGSGDITVDLHVQDSQEPDYVYIRVWLKPGRLHTVSSVVPLRGEREKWGQLPPLAPLPMIPVP